MQVRAIVLSRQDIYSCQHDLRAEYRPLSVWSRSRVYVRASMIPEQGIDSCECGVRTAHRPLPVWCPNSAYRPLLVCRISRRKTCPTRRYMQDIKLGQYGNQCRRFYHVFCVSRRGTMKRPKPRNKLRGNDTPGYRKLGILSTYMDDLRATAAR
nr:hypothetical protein CFP56_12113 [Quercus suber]